MKQHFVVRLQRDVTVHLPGGAHLLKNLAVKEGEHRNFGFVSLRADSFVRKHLPPPRLRVFKWLSVP